MILFKNVTKEQAKQAAAFYSREGWTLHDVGSAMGWSKTKAAKIIRNFDKWGIEAFANDRGRKTTKAVRAGDKQKASKPVEVRASKSAGSYPGNGQRSPLAGVGARA